MAEFMSYPLYQANTIFGYKMLRNSKMIRMLAASILKTNNMKQKKNSKNNQSERIKNLFRYCAKCKRWLGTDDCNHSWTYRMVLRDKFGKTRTKSFSKDMSKLELIESTTEFRNLILNGQPNSRVPVITVNINEEMQAYRDFLSDIGISDEQRKNFTPKHITDQMRFVKWFCEYIKSNNGSDTIDISQLKQYSTPQFNEYLQGKSLSEATIKNAIKRLDKWCSFIIKERTLKIKTI